MVKPVKITEVVSDCFKSPSELPPEQLTKRIETAKKYFLQSIERDCRQTTEFLDEWRGKELYKHFCESWEEFCSKYFERPAEWLDYIADGLKLLDNAKPIPAEKAVEASKLKGEPGKPDFTPDRKRQPSPETLEKAKRAKELKEQGMIQEDIAKELGVNQKYVSRLVNTPLPDSYTTDTCYNVTSVGSKDAPPRPKTRGNSKEYRQALLDRDAPELAEKTRAGELSAHAAAKKLGKVRSHTLNIGPKTDPVKLAQKLVEIDRELAISIALEIQNLCTEEQL